MGATPLGLSFYFGLKLADLNGDGAIDIACVVIGTNSVTTLTFAVNWNRGVRFDRARV